MFRRWCKSLAVWWNNGSNPPPAADTAPVGYEPGERMIYRYFNGAETVAADPMHLYKRMMEVGPELTVDFKVAESASKDSPRAFDKVIGGIRGIFGVKSFEEGGLTEQETIDLFDSWIEYTDTLKKNSSLLPTYRIATPPTPPTSSEDDPGTRSSSDSGSTGTGPSTGGPLPSPSVAE